MVRHLKNRRSVLENEDELKLGRFRCRVKRIVLSEEDLVSPCAKTKSHETEVEQEAETNHESGVETKRQARNEECLARHRIHRGVQTSQNETFLNERSGDKHLGHAAHVSFGQGAYSDEECVGEANHGRRGSLMPVHGDVPVNSPLSCSSSMRGFTDDHLSNDDMDYRRRKGLVAARPSSVSTVVSADMLRLGLCESPLLPADRGSAYQYREECRYGDAELDCACPEVPEDIEESGDRNMLLRIREEDGVLVVESSSSAAEFMETHAVTPVEARQRNSGDDCSVPRHRRGQEEQNENDHLGDKLTEKRSPNSEAKEEGSGRGNDSRAFVPSCRICLCEEENRAEDPLLSPCLCKGSMSWVHLRCLRLWMSGRLNISGDVMTSSDSGDHCFSWYWRPLECELCKRLYPTYITLPETPAASQIWEHSITSQSFNSAQKLIQSIIRHPILPEDEQHVSTHFSPIISCMNVRVISLRSVRQDY